VDDILGKDIEKSRKEIDALAKKIYKERKALAVVVIAIHEIPKQGPIDTACVSGLSFRDGKITLMDIGDVVGALSMRITKRAIDNGEVHPILGDISDMPDPDGMKH